MKTAAIASVPKRHLEIMRHALGLQDDGSGSEYRNYYYTQDSDPVLCAMVEAGLMYRANTMEQGMRYFVVTLEGRDLARTVDPKPAVSKRRELSRSRYEQYLEIADLIDGGFREYLRMQYYKPAHLRPFRARR